MGRHMRLSTLYWGLALLGAAIPLAAFLPWLELHGVDLPLLLRDLFANRVSASSVWTYCYRLSPFSS